MTKTREEYFKDWHADTFGFGYGTGELHTIPALKRFLELCNRGDRSKQYDYRILEMHLGPAVAWLLINALCRAGVIEYGSSPRFAWLSSTGERLKDFVSSFSADELIELACTDTEGYFSCSYDSCNCGPHGYEEGKLCPNPFWRD